MALKELDSAPSLTALYPRALAGATARPVLGRVPLVGGRFRAGDELPDTQLALKNIEIDPDHLAAYNRVCGFRLRDELPPTYPHMLGFPLQIALMTETHFPFAVLGLVHVRNRIEQLRPIKRDETLNLHVHASGLRQHPRGRQFDLVTEATVGSEQVWKSRSTYLHREGGGSGGDKKKRESPVDVPEPSAIWELPGDTGRRYASVSGDRNPIHLHPITARLFGMPKPIAHGMWTKARALAALEGALPDAYRVDVTFKLPIFLPAKVAFSSRIDAGRRLFAVRAAKDGKPHLDGTVDPA
jgi:acyl dehydratase